MASSNANIKNHLKITSTTAEMRGDVICVLISRGGWIKTKHATATMTMVDEEGSKVLPNKIIVTYSAATATMVGITACRVANVMIRKLCLYKAGWVIWNPLSRKRKSQYPTGV